MDVLIEFEPEDTPGLFALARMQFEIEAVVGRLSGSPHAEKIRAATSVKMFFDSAEMPYSAV